MKFFYESLGQGVLPIGIYGWRVCFLMPCDANTEHGVDAASEKYLKVRREFPVIEMRPLAGP